MMIHEATILLRDLELLKAEVKASLPSTNGRLTSDQVTELCRIKSGLNAIVDTLVEEAESFRRRFDAE